MSGHKISQRSGKSRRREDIQRDRLFAQSLDLLAVADLEGYFRDVNPAWERMLGWSVAELKARPFIEFVLPEDREATLAAFDGIREGAEVVTFEIRYRHKDGSSRWLLWSAAPDLEHGVVYSTARDITDRKRAEEQISRLAAIVESSDDAIIGMSLGGVIESWNPGAETVFGHRSAEVLDKPMKMLIPPGHADHLPELLAQIRRGQKVTHYETVRMRKDGEVINVSLTLSPVRDASGAVIGASAIARDITDRKRAERERLDLLHRLENTVARSRRMTGALHCCKVCRKVRDESGYWRDIEEYVSDHSEARVLPALCPDHAPEQAGSA